MSTLNRVFLMGNLTRDPEVRYTSTGTAVGDLGLAVNENYRNKVGEIIESTVFVDIEVWARQAEACAEHLSKGSPIFVEGRLKLDQWENQQGEKRKKLRVRADRVQFLGVSRKTIKGTDAPNRIDPPTGTDAAPSAAPSVAPVVDDDNIPF